MITPHRRSLAVIFGVPSMIGLLSAVGLLAALIGDAVWDLLSWLTLLVPIALCIHFVMRGRRTSAPR